MAAVDAIGLALLALSFAGSVYIMTGLARRLAATGLRWSAGHPARRLLLAVAGLAGISGAGRLLGRTGPVPRLVARVTAERAARAAPLWRAAGYLGWNRIPPSNRMTSAFM